MTKINTQTPVDKSIFKTSKVLIVITIIWAIVNCIIVILVHLADLCFYPLFKGTKEFNDLIEEKNNCLEAIRSIQHPEINDVYTMQILERQLEEITKSSYIHIAYKLNKKISIPSSILYIVYHILTIYIFITYYFKFFSLGGLLYGFLSIIIFFSFIYSISEKSPIILSIIFFIALFINLFITARYFIHPYISKMKIQEQAIRMLNI